MEHTSATIRPAIWRTILSSRLWPSPGSAMISRRRRSMGRRAGSAAAMRGSSVGRLAINPYQQQRSPFLHLVRGAGAAASLKRSRRRELVSTVTLLCPLSGAGRKLVGVQSIKRMQRAHRELRIGSIDEDADFDLGGRDRQDVDAFVC